jgi:hypothetical protein
MFAKQDLSMFVEDDPPNRHLVTRTNYGCREALHPGWQNSPDFKEEFFHAFIFTVYCASSGFIIT